jgi:hypothetical protein
MNGQTPQVPQNCWHATLQAFAWAWRIPLAFFIVFTCGCVGFLAVVFCARLTVWLYDTYLAHPF